MKSPSKTGKSLRVGSFFVEFVGVFSVFFIYAGSRVPAINEPHYWTKAAHFWNSNFGQGDLFLESGDAHWLFFATFGLFTTFFKIESAVWIGRILTWIILAAGWTALGRSIWILNPNARPECEPNSSGAFQVSPNKSTNPPALFTTMWAVLWLAAMHWGHWAGEWVVGGCESKGIAYGLLFFGLASAIRGRWLVAWLMLGGAAAFHVVVGIWVIGSVLVASLVLQKPSSRLFGRWSNWFLEHRIGLMLSFAGVVVGLVPALILDWGTDSKISTESGVKQAYLRLGHHLAPSRFSSERWIAFEWHLLIMILLVLAVCRSRVLEAYSTAVREDKREKFLGNVFVAMIQDGRNVFRNSPYGFQFLSLCALTAFLAAAAGLALDFTLSKNHPDIAAKILRLYWFRWNDVSFSMMSSLLLCSFAYGLLQYQPAIMRIRWLAAAIAFATGAMLIWSRMDSAMQEKIPAGDKSHFVAKSDSESEQLKQYEDWIRVCDWIRSNTDQQGLWLTPRRQQSFKWHTGRPELACWKDAPQNAVALVEWGNRLADAYRFDGKKVLMPMSDKILWDLRKKYGIRYVLLDRRVLQQSPPLLPILYPTHDQINDSFAVFEFPQDELTFPPKL